MNEPLSFEGFTPLLHWGVIRARGEDAASFLQSQLTNDVATLSQSEARLAGYCSPKGRLLATFIVLKMTADELLLVCNADVLPATLKRLSMFVLRARCRLSDASKEMTLTGLVGQSALHWLGSEAPHVSWGSAAARGGRAVRLPDVQGLPRFLYVGQLETSALPPLPIQTWRWLDVLSGVPWIEVATVEQFVPQMVNFELVGGVSFQKGCYPGQEVVARSQYRGTVKRRLALFDCAVEARAGQEIFHSGDAAQPAGMVVNAASGPDGGSSLSAEVKLAALGEGALRLGSSDGSLLVNRTLPYALPVDTK